MAGPRKTKTVKVGLTEEQFAKAAQHAGGENRIAAMFRALLSLLDSGEARVPPSEIDKHNSPASGRGRKPKGSE